MNITLRQLRAFCAVVECGSFTRAAQDLSVTQSALSGLIRELEQGLGAQVLYRSTRRVNVSDGGREFYPLACKVLQDLDGALEAMADLRPCARAWCGWPCLSCWPAPCCRTRWRVSPPAIPRCRYA